jgi:hypothetical protein
MESVKDYYEVLGVGRTAAPEEIKRSYFARVRQYPPERFPEEFKELRAAYDTLSDKEKRAEYDENGSLPESILPLLYQGRKAGNLGRHAKAAEFYKSILRLHPELDKIREEYAWALEDSGKTGKATEVWEYLCKQCPSNAGYALSLAESYGNRLWHKKALAQYRRALELDKSDPECWLSFIKYLIEMDECDEARVICRQALDAVGETGGIYLYLTAFMLFETEDAALAGQNLETIILKAKEMHSGASAGASPFKEDDYEAAVFILLSRIEEQDSIHFFPYIKEMAALLPRINDEQRERLDWAERNYDITTIESKGFGSLFHDLLLIRNNEDDSREMKNHMTAMEYILLSETHTYYPQLLRLKEEYPNLYNLHKNFFDEALGARNREKLMLQRTKALAKQNLQPVGYTDGEEDEWAEPVETIRRESPKVGRNDPCPCGSGKKYKKCCGA